MTTSPDSVGSVALVAGQWAVWNDAAYWASDPRYEVALIVKATEKTFTHMKWDRETRRNRGDELFCGSEADAKALAEKLTSSAGLMKDEVRRSRERHKAREADLIAKATATPSAMGSGE